MAYLCYTTCRNFDARTATLFCIATAFNQQASRAHAMKMWTSIFIQTPVKVHTHWSWSVCGLPRVSSALRRRWRRSVLQQRSKKSSREYEREMWKSVSIQTPINSAHCTPTLVHKVFVLYLEFQLRCQDGNAVPYRNSAQPKGIPWTNATVDIDCDINTSKQRIPTLGYEVFVGYHVIQVGCE